MKRKVVLHGPSTLTISLPSRWIKNYNIQKGDELEIEDKGKSLVIHSQKSKSPKKSTIDISNLDPLIKRAIIKFYQEGDDEIHVSFNDPNLIQKVREIVTDELIGYEIIKHDTNSCKIKDITGESEDNFEVLLKRLFILLEGMLKDGIKAIENKDKILLESIRNREVEVDRISNFCIRNMNKKKEKELIKKFLTIYHCEKVGDMYYKLINIILKEKSPQEKEFITIHKEVNEFFSNIYDFVLDTKMEKAVRIAKNLERLKKKIESHLDKKTNSTKISIMREMLENIVGIQDIRLSTLRKKIE